MKLQFLTGCAVAALCACGGSELAINEHDQAPPEGSAESETSEPAGRQRDLDLHAVSSPVSYAETVDRVHRELARRNLDVVATIDHAEGSEGLETRPTTLFIFRVGETDELLDENPTMALDLPQRMLVYTTGRSSVFIVWRPAASLADAHDAREHDRVREIEQMCEQIAAAASAPPENTDALR